MGTSMAATFTFISCIHGYIKTRETVNCQRNARNPEDSFTVGLKKDGATVGHVTPTKS